MNNYEAVEREEMEFQVEFSPFGVVLNAQCIIHIANSNIEFFLISNKKKQNRQ